MAVETFTVLMLILGIVVLFLAVVIIVGFVISMFIASVEAWFHRRDL